MDDTTPALAGCTSIVPIPTSYRRREVAKMIKIKVLYPSEKRFEVAWWAKWQPELEGKVDFKVPGSIFFFGAKQAHKAKEAKTLFG